MVQARVERLVDRLLDYMALVERCTAADQTATVAAALNERGVCSVVVPPRPLQEWTAELSPDVRVLRDAPDERHDVSGLERRTVC